MLMPASTQHPLTTVGALITGPSNRILIARTTKWQGTWGVPGGKVEWGETLEDALKREFLEEVGLKLFDIEFALLQEAVIDPQFHKDAHFVLVNYYAQTNSEVVTPNEEIEEWVWVTPEQAKRYPLNDYTRILINAYQAHYCLDPA